jgi:hypothetical protein
MGTLLGFAPFFDFVAIERVVSMPAADILGRTYPAVQGCLPGLKTVRLDQKGGAR